MKPAPPVTRIPCIRVSRKSQGSGKALRLSEALRAGVLGGHRGSAPCGMGHVTFRSGSFHRSFSWGCSMVVQPAKNVARRSALVVLNEARINARRGKFAPLPGLEEIISAVAEDVGANQHDIGY